MPLFGWLLALASGIEVVQAIMVGHWAGFFHHLVAAVLFGVTGFLLVTRPVLSAEVATMLMAVFFLVSGLFQFIGSIWVALPGWGWQAVDGIIAIVLGFVSGGAWQWTNGNGAMGSAAGAGGLLFLAPLVMILFRQKSCRRAQGQKIDSDGTCQDDHHAERGDPH